MKTSERSDRAGLLRTYSIKIGFMASCHLFQNECGKNGKNKMMALHGNGQHHSPARRPDDKHTKKNKDKNVGFGPRPVHMYMHVHVY